MASTGSNASMTSNTVIHFFDLPRELRDKIYAYFPHLAVIHINQDPDVVKQPALTAVNHQMRNECLDAFYSGNKYFLDLRGWKSEKYPRSWTPWKIFQEWISAIREQNASRLRSISFFSHNFRVNVKISNEKPAKIALKFRTSPEPMGTEVATGVPPKYSFNVAARRAEQGFRIELDRIERDVGFGNLHGLTVDNVKDICTAVDNIQPYLCTRMNLGYQGAVLRVDGAAMEKWPKKDDHIDKCDDCGYHRFARRDEQR